MVFNNPLNANGEGIQYLSTAGAWAGVDASTAGDWCISLGTGVSPAFLPATSSLIIYKVNKRILTSGSSYTPTSGTKYVFVEVVGAGGGGGYAGGTATTVDIGSSGGSGEYRAKVFPRSAFGGSVAYGLGGGGAGGTSSLAPGNGGNTNFGAFITSNGGKGGSNGTNTATAYYLNGGAGGSGGSGGDIVVPGQHATNVYSPGGAAAPLTSAYLLSVAGSTKFGTGTYSAANSSIIDGQGHGSGGSGNQCILTVNVSARGGNGANGMIVITEYI